MFQWLMRRIRQMGWPWSWNSEEYIEDRGSDIAQDIREETLRQRDQGYQSYETHNDQSNQME